MTGWIYHRTGRAPFRSVCRHPGLVFNTASVRIVPPKHNTPDCVCGDAEVEEKRTSWPTPSEPTGAEVEDLLLKIARACDREGS
jgi:hypothetical protein